jgi:hypothetical protein
MAIFRYAASDAICMSESGPFSVFAKPGMSDPGRP